jgi:hypothetical protein
MWEDRENRNCSRTDQESGETESTGKQREQKNRENWGDREGEH